MEGGAIEVGEYDGGALRFEPEGDGYALDYRGIIRLIFSAE